MAGGATVVFLTMHSTARRLSLLLLLPCVLLSIANGRSQEPTLVDLAVSPTASSTRVILTHSKQVVCVVEASRGKINIRYAEPVELDPPQARFDDPIFKRYRQRDERTISLETGRSYDRYETFELRNPFRLVVDLKATPKKDAAAESGPKKRGEPSTIIVIDPGHGGVEHGAVGPSGLMEKEITLALARRLKRSLERGRSSSLSVVLTRDEDRLMGLDERTAIANHNRAELFVSIHLNASPRSEASGAETYFLSTDATDDEALRLVARENLGGAKLPGGLDLVLWDLAQNVHLASSGALAESIQRQLNQLTGTRNRGVRQAPFRVLMGAMMPAVLVEVGFISNPEQEALMRTSSYRDDIVDALAVAIRKFLLNLDQVSAPASVRPANR